MFLQLLPPEIPASSCLENHSSGPSCNLLFLRRLTIPPPPNSCLSICLQDAQPLFPKSLQRGSSRPSHLPRGASLTQHPRAFQRASWSRESWALSLYNLGHPARLQKPGERGTSPLSLGSEMAHQSQPSHPRRGRRIQLPAPSPQTGLKLAPGVAPPRKAPEMRALPAQVGVAALAPSDTRLSSCTLEPPLESPLPQPDVR